MILLIQPVNQPVNPPLHQSWFLEVIRFVKGKEVNQFSTHCWEQTLNKIKQSAATTTQYPQSNHLFWDSGRTGSLHCSVLDWWLHLATGPMVLGFDCLTASLPTLFSKEVTSIHPITLFTQVRRERRTEKTQRALSNITLWGRKKKVL